MDNCYPFFNTPLPYDYNALEPYIDEKTMKLHHDRHLQTYLDNLNEALEEACMLKKMPLNQLLFVRDNLKIKNNAGGVYNHRFFFNGMINSADKMPCGSLETALNRAYGSFDGFKSKFKTAALSVFGSGYSWLVLDSCGKLKITSTANQNTPLTSNLRPILCIDVWEHAYYLKHYNKRGDYIEDWFRVVNWKAADEIYNSLKRHCKL